MQAVFKVQTAAYREIGEFHTFAVLVYFCFLRSKGLIQSGLMLGLPVEF